MLRQVGEQDGHVERDLLGRVEEAAEEGGVLDVALVVRLGALQQELDLLAVEIKVKNFGAASFGRKASGLLTFGLLDT